jgi:hypothetical protein
MIYPSNLKRFGKTNWTFFSGATRFDDGDDPYITEINIVDGKGVILLIDKNGADIYNEDFGIYTDDVVMALTVLSEGMTRNEFEKATEGWKRIF